MVRPFLSQLGSPQPKAHKRSVKCTDTTRSIESAYPPQSGVYFLAKYLIDKYYLDRRTFSYWKRDLTKRFANRTWWKRGETGMKRMIDWREGKQGLKTRLILALRHRAICPKQIRLSDECEECHQKSYRKGIIAKIAQIPFMSLA